MSVKFGQGVAVRSRSRDVCWYRNGRWDAGGVAGSGRERQETVGWCQYWGGLYTTSFPPEIPRCAVCWSYVSGPAACPLVYMLNNGLFFLDF